MVPVVVGIYFSVQNKKGDFQYCNYCWSYLLVKGNRLYTKEQGMLWHFKGFLENEFKEDVMNCFKKVSQ